MPLPRPENDDIYSHLEFEAWGPEGPRVDRRGTGRLKPGHVSKYTRSDYLSRPSIRAMAYGLESDPFIRDLENWLGMSALDLLPESNDRYEFFQDVEYFKNLSRRHFNKNSLMDTDQERYDIEGDPVFNSELGGEYVSPEEGYQSSRGVVPPTGASPYIMNPRTGQPYNKYRYKNVTYTSDFNKEIPTQTTNPMRPRTVAAIWDVRNRVLTVVFRDGTFYNYYECDMQTWLSFKQAQSKGHFILQVLNNKPRGPADMTNVPSDVREFLYRAARTAQVRMYADTFKAPNVRDYWNTKKSYAGSYAAWKKAGKPGTSYSDWVDQQNKKLAKIGHAKAASQIRQKRYKKK